MGMRDIRKGTTKYPGIYRGTVVDNNDPDKFGKIKIRIHPMMDEESIQIAALPWAVPAYPIHEGSGAGYGFFSIPRLNTKVWVFFEANDFMQPVYFAEALDETRGKPTFVNTNYPDRKGIRWANGLELIIDEFNDDVIINHPSGTVISIDVDGKVVINSVDEVDITGTVVNINPAP